MKIIKYIQLSNYLIKEEDANLLLVFNTINQVRKLPDELKSAVLDILEGKTPEIEYHDVSLNELIVDDKMKPIRAILMLDWIRREPAVAMRYMGMERYRAPQTVTESDMALLQAASEKLAKNKPHKDRSNVVEEDKSDITFGDK